ncbi:hypothetical protein ASZ90_016155 [hydrocarbon metagenome]|uniref:Uncharacterized protein n=1 Tax=hydrocarbon metagenome TaxID=938273 RepID=A0A0W8EZZ6_9ZZZZ
MHHKWLWVFSGLVSNPHDEGCSGGTTRGGDTTGMFLHYPTPVAVP